MIQLKSRPGGGFELTDRSQTVVLFEQTIILGEEKISEPGEYEAHGVEVVYGKHAGLLVWERLQILYVFNAEKPTAFDREQFSSADVVIFAPTEELTKAAYNDLLSAYDPTICVFARTLEIEPGLKDGLKLQEETVVKLTEQNLPTEGRESYAV